LFAHRISENRFALFGPMRQIATNADGGRLRNTEIMTLEDGKITEVEVYFGCSLPHEGKGGRVHRSMMRGDAGNAVVCWTNTLIRRFAPPPASGRKGNKVADSAIHGNWRIGPRVRSLPRFSRR
jgi:hypothetical protein